MTKTIYRPGHKKGPKGQIYFVQLVGTPFVKIGFSQNVVARLYALQTSTPLDLKLLRVFPGYRRDEKVLHWRHRKKHVRGEWFRLGKS
jgi:hypothetical protein